MEGLFGGEVAKQEEAKKVLGTFFFVQAHPQSRNTLSEQLLPLVGSVHLFLHRHHRFFFILFILFVFFILFVL